MASQLQDRVTFLEDEIEQMWSVLSMHHLVLKDAADKQAEKLKKEGIVIDDSTTSTN